MNEYYIYKSEVCADKVIKSNIPIKFQRACSFHQQTALRHISFPGVTFVSCAFYILHVIPGGVSCLQSSPPRSRKRNDITSRRRKDERRPSSRVSRPKSRREGKERLALCKVTCIVARAAQAERTRAHCVREAAPWISRSVFASRGGEPRRPERRRKRG